VPIGGHNAPVLIGRKAVLVDRMLANPPRDVDVLLLEGTTLGCSGGFPTESELEDRFVRVFREARGRVFVTWSAQNIDRTVTVYRASKRAGRTLVLDLYAVYVLERRAQFGNRLLQLGWESIAAVVTNGSKRILGNAGRLNDREFVDRCCRSGRAFSASQFETGHRNNVVMLRPLKHPTRAPALKRNTGGSSQERHPGRIRFGFSRTQIRNSGLSRTCSSHSRVFR